MSTPQKLLGMLELDAAGTVLYSRLEESRRSVDIPAPNINGNNLYDHFTFSNTTELRQRINEFTHSQRKADNFDFTFQYNDGPLVTRVLLVRVSERRAG